MLFGLTKIDTMSEPEARQLIKDFLNAPPEAEFIPKTIF